MAANEPELLRLDYEQTVALVRMLNEVRFKLLAFVPTVAGTGVALLSAAASNAERLAGGLVGLVATLGVLVYDVRNNQHYARASARAAELERRLGLTLVQGAGGGFSAAPPSGPLGQLLALGLVYGAAAGAWAYVVAWALLALADFPSPKTWGGVVGVVAAIVVAGGMNRLGEGLGEDRPAG